jgi:hypothetical protein
MQFAKDPSTLILPDMLDLYGPLIIEKHIKLVAFCIANPRLSKQGPPSKKQRINLNTPPNTYNQQKKAGMGCGRGGGRYSGGSHSGGSYPKFVATS